MLKTSLIFGILIGIIVLVGIISFLIPKTSQSTTATTSATTYLSKSISESNNSYITKNQAFELFPYTKFSYNETPTLDAAGVNYTGTGKLFNVSSGTSVFISNESSGIDLGVVEFVMNSNKSNEIYNFFVRNGGSLLLLTTNESQGVKYSLYSNNDANLSNPYNTYSLLAWKNKTFVDVRGRASVGYGTPGWNVTKLNTTLLTKIVVSDLAQQ